MILLPFIIKFPSLLERNLRTKNTQIDYLDPPNMFRNQLFQLTERNYMALQINRAITRKFKNKTFADKYSHSVLFVAK